MKTYSIVATRIAAGRNHNHAEKVSCFCNGFRKSIRKLVVITHHIFSHFRSGLLCFGPGFLSFVALGLSLFANLRCSLVKPALFGLTSLFSTAPESIGLWCYAANNGSLYDIRDISVGDLYQAARALGIVSIITGMIVVVLYAVAGCIRVPSMLFAGLGVISILTCLFQGLVFLIFKSDLCEFGCSLDTGGKCAVAATVFWFLTGVSSCAAGRDAKDD